ncbi:dipeptidase [Candidatus Marinamargulisbacteria bacterium SCGC AG-343-K17]|nr:dipeptidase [Candidatus Marinamargulisbacteria bacterium SCGC AG-343-K17]
MLQSALSYLNNHFDLFTDDLKDCLKIPSISTLPDSEPAVKQCSEHVASHMRAIGLKNVQQFNDYGHPIIYADYIIDSSKPTLLCYGHYDVQPVDPLNLWDTPPFDPKVRDGYIFARGASDNKGMFYAQLKAVESYLKSAKSLPVNVKFIIEGEEEIGSHGLIKFIKDHASLLQYDVLVVSDSPMFSDTQPSICTSLRGLIYLECRIKAMNHDVHSGQLGGSVPNVIHYLSDCISSMKDPKTNRVLIPGFYDDVAQFGAFNSQLPVAQQHLSNLKSFYSLGEHANEEFFNNIWFLPTLDCNGIQSGFVSEGAKTVVPCEAMVKLSCRLVPNQSPDHMVTLVTNYIRQFFPDSFDVQIDSVGPYAKPLQVDPSDSFIQAALNAVKDTHQKDVIIQGEGGSIPVLAEFQALFSKPTVLIGLNSPNDNIHAPNERFKLDHYRKGIETYIRYFNYL